MPFVPPPSLPADAPSSSLVDPTLTEDYSPPELILEPRSPPLVLSVNTDIAIDIPDVNCALNASSVVYTTIYYFISRSIMSEYFTCQAEPMDISSVFYTTINYFIYRSNMSDFFTSQSEPMDIEGEINIFIYKKNNFCLNILFLTFILHPPSSILHPQNN